MYREGAMEGEKRESGISVLGGGGSRSAQREPPASRRLLTTFSLMEFDFARKTD